MMKNYLLPILSLCLFVLIILAIPGKDAFKIRSADMIEPINAHEYIVSADALKDLEKENKVVLVDLREKESYSRSHISGAVNLPAKELSVNKIHKFFNDQAVYVLYSGVNSTASQEWILITQMGVENVFVLQ